MKKTILTMAAIAFMAVTASTAFGQNIDKKSEKARENITEEKKDVVNAKHDLKEAQLDSVADYQNFKKESNEKILSNEKSIANLKVKISKADSKDKADYEKKLGVLEQKNVNLKKRLVNYNLKGESKWSSFKSGFNKDMEELEKELKDFTVSIKSKV